MLASNFDLASPMVDRDFQEFSACNEYEIIALGNIAVGVYKLTFCCNVAYCDANRISER